MLDFVMKNSSKGVLVDEFEETDFHKMRLKTYKTLFKNSLKELWLDFDSCTIHPFVVELLWSIIDAGLMYNF